MTKKLNQTLLILFVAISAYPIRAQGQALDLLIDQKLKNTSHFTQFATFYRHDNCQLFIETAKEDRQVVLERFEETDFLGNFVQCGEFPDSRFEYIYCDTFSFIV